MSWKEWLAELLKKLTGKTKPPVKLPPPVVKPPPIVEGDKHKALLAELNRVKAENGLPALVVDPLLDSLAQAQADFNRDRGTYELTHQDGSGRWPYERAVAVAYEGQKVGEIVAGGQSSAKQALDDWQLSPGHNRELMDPDYNEVGRGYASGGYWGSYYVLFFGRGRVEPARTRYLGETGLENGERAVI